MMFQSHLAMSGDSQSLTSMSCIPGIREVHLSHPIAGILENIEPETVYAEYDASHSMVPHQLLSSLNRLCEKQLLRIVRWSKSLPGNAALQLGVAISWQAFGGRSRGLYDDTKNRLKTSSSKQVFGLILSLRGNNSNV